MNIDEHRFLDITEPDYGVQIEYDRVRGVLYVHVDGVTALRICRIKVPVEFVELRD